MKYKAISLDSLGNEGKLKGHDTLAEFLDQFLKEQAGLGWEFVSAISFLGWQSCLIFKQAQSYPD
jgi:hypothetical protein